MADTSGADLMRFLDYAAKKGLVNPSTASAVKVAAKRVLGVEGDLDSLDVSSVDVDTLFKRFENLHRTELTPRSLETYRARVNMGIGWFLDWSRDPAGWKPVSRPARSGSNGETKGKASQRSGTASHEEPRGATLKLPDQQRGRLVDYPFPLREGLMVRLQLPPDLKQAEVRRLTAWMNTLTTDSPSDQLS